MSEAAPTSEGPVTIVVSRRIKPGHELDYEVWLAGTTQVLAEFPGYLGCSTLRPDEHTGQHHVFIPRFDSLASAEGWAVSPERESRLEALALLVEGEPRVERLSGLEFWFRPPAGSTGTPPRWKMLCVTLAVVWPLTFVLPVILKPVMAVTPPFFQSLVPMLVMMPLMTYVLMPVAMRVFAFWLFETKAG